jgi:hypothetical protein
MWTKDKGTKEKVFRDREDAMTDWTCHYCPEVATTIRQGAAVCWLHAIQLRKVGWS